MLLNKIQVRMLRLEETVRVGFRRAKVQIFGKWLYRRVLIDAKPCHENCDKDLPREIEILSPFWGARFALMFVDTCLPSVLQSGIDQLCLKVPTRLTIYCPPSDWQEIKNKVVKRVGNLPIDVKWFSLDSSDEDKKSNLISFVRLRVQAAIGLDRVIVFAFPDNIFGRGLDRIIKNSKSGVFVVCFQIRISFELAAKLMKSVIEKNSYSNRDLVRHGLVDFPHPLVQKALESRFDYLTISKYGDDYLGYFKEPPPLLMRGTEHLFELGFNKPFFGSFECIDHDIPNLMLKKGMLRAIADSESFCWLEHTPEASYKKMITNNFNLESALYFKNFGVKFTIN